MLAEKIWNETNLQEVAQDWIFKRNLLIFKWKMKSD